jgi:hypothetical protein
VLSTGPGGAVASTYVGVFSRGGETARVGFPAGWTSGGFPDLGQSGPAPTVVTTTPDGPDTVLPLDAGEFGVVHGRGPAPVAGGLEVVANGERSGRIAGTVRNSTEFRLDDVAVFAGADGNLVGALGPGEERSFTVANAGLLRPDGGAEFRMWAGARSDQSGLMADIALWQAAVQAGGANFRAPGVLVAAGFTSEFSPELRKGRATTRPPGKTMVLGRTRVHASPDGPLELAVRRDVVRDPFANRFVGMGAGGASVVRFVLPEGADTSHLVLRAGFPSAELWRDGAWQAAECRGPNCAAIGPPQCPPGVPCPLAVPPMMRGGGGPGGLEFAVPPAAVRDGVVYARVPGPASFDLGAAITLRTAP